MNMVMNGPPLSRSEYLHVRGLRYHVRRWGDPSLPLLFMCHGWLDVSATFAPLVRPLLDRWQVAIPDWRGFGHSEWPQDGYWFFDYVGDLDILADHYSPRQPLLLVGHSMGAQAASLYAGLRPQRVRKLICLDGIGMPETPLQQAPQRARRWLDQLRVPPPLKSYPSFEDLAERIRHQHHRLTPEGALFVAHCWGQQDGHGRITLCADPRHTLTGPQRYRSDDAEEIWRQITAPTLFVDAADSTLTMQIPPEERSRRRGAFRDQRTVLIQGSGHMLHFDAPEATAAAIAAFMAE